MMRFDNLSTEVRTKEFGSFARQPKQHIHSDTEIRCEDDRHRVCYLFNRFALGLRVTGRSNDDRFAMLQRGAKDFIDAVGLTEVDCHVTIFHRRLDRIPQIASCGDFDFPFALRQIEHSFSHAPSRADEHYAHGRILHDPEQPAIASILILPMSCAGAFGSLRSSRTAANELQAISLRASRGLSSREPGWAR